MSHGPPFEILDFIPLDPMGRWKAQNCGDSDHLNRMRQLKLPLNVFGHIHEARGTKKVGKTQFINASSLNGTYRPYPIPYTLIEMNTKTKEVTIL